MGIEFSARPTFKQKSRFEEDRIIKGDDSEVTYILLGLGHVRQDG